MNNLYDPKFVEKLFDNMSASYHRMNYITSFGFSELWREQCVRVLDIQKGKVTVDLMTGMGECWKHILKRSDETSTLIALDFSTEMIRQAEARKTKYKNARIKTLKENVFENTIPDESADYVVSGFVSQESERIKSHQMLQLVRTDSQNPDFIELVRHLDAELAVRDGAEHAFYSQFNKIAMIKHAIVAYENEKPVGCGAIKAYEPDTMEVKRMYVPPEHRGKGIAAQVLAELENWAAELSMTRCILETGTKQPEAIALYRKSGYQQIPNYGQYLNVENSVCFEKHLLLG